MEAGCDPLLIYDVGAHRGEDTAFYLLKGFRVVAVEASPVLAAELRDRFAGEIAAGQLEVLNAAIASDARPVPFFANTRKSNWGTTSLRRAERNRRRGAPSRVVMVDGVPFETVLHRFGMPYYLKIDIEGVDGLCLEALRTFPCRPRYVSLESTQTSWDELVAEFDLLESLGYHRFKVVAQHQVDKQVPPNPAREGRHVPHRFELGSTGQFGAEAPGEWVDRETALEMYRPVFTAYALFGDDGIVKRDAALAEHLAKYVPAPTEIGWYDTHARLG